MADHPMADLLAKEVRATVAQALSRLGAPTGAGVAIVLSGDDRLEELNERYRGREGPTDVLSFASTPDSVDPAEPPYLGDVIVSLDRAAAQADALGHGLLEEVRLLAVHGLLHLLGYDDVTDAQAEEMEERERQLGVRR